MKSSLYIQNLCSFATEFGRNLEKDCVSETSGHFKRLLVSMCQGAREENAAVDIEKAKREAQELYQAGEKKWGTDESKFNQIIAVRSFPQLRATFDEYVRVGNRRERGRGREGGRERESS